MRGAYGTREQNLSGLGGGAAGDICSLRAELGGSFGDCLADSHCLGKFNGTQFAATGPNMNDAHWRFNTRFVMLALPSLVLALLLIFLASHVFVSQRETLEILRLRDDFAVRLLRPCTAPCNSPITASDGSKP